MARGLDKGMALDLVREIEGGSTTAWHRFVDEYAGLIHAVIRRHLKFAGAEARRELFVRVLSGLSEGALFRYDGRTRLSTWLFIFTRSRCIDHLRSSHGRRSLPPWLHDLSALDQRVFRLYYLEGLGIRVIQETLAQDQLMVTVDELAASLERLEARLDEGTRRRMAYDLFAQSVGAASGRLLAFLHGLRIEYEETDGNSGNPEAALLRQEVEQAAEQVRVFVERLPEEERRVIALRYYEGRTAREAASELQLESQRKVYSVETRALKRLRGMFKS